MVSRKDQIKDILIRARNILKPEGVWIKGAFHSKSNGQDSYCMLGALNAACFGEEYYRRHIMYPMLKYEVQEAARTILGDILEEKVGTRSVASFNDNVKTEKSDVIDIFNLAIERVEN